MFPKVLALLFGLLLLAHFTVAEGKAILEASNENIRIVVYDEPCRLSEVSNLKYRVTWTENGKEIEGCIGPRPDIGYALAYFADKTVVPIPMDAFRRLTET
jgi:tRNA G10  N-methylase Trm11